MLALLDLPSAAARRLLATGVPVFLPVNPVEYHGPHLSLHNDQLVCAGYLRDLHARLWAETPFVVVRDLEVGVDPVPGPGSRPVAFTTVRRLVEDACAAVADLGAQRVVVGTFHGSPMHNHALQAGVALLERRGVRAVAPFNELLRRLLTIDGHVYAAAFAHVADVDVREEMMRTLGRDYHAGFCETSLALHYAPDSVDPRYVDLPPCPPATPARPLVLAARAARVVGRDELATELEFAAWGLGWYGLRPFPAYTSRPALATAAAGAILAGQLVQEAAVLVADVLAGRAPSPRPIMSWMVPLTAGGRVGPVAVPAAAIEPFFAPRVPGPGGAGCGCATDGPGG
jgi:creatinine amidohydrolase